MKLKKVVPKKIAIVKLAAIGDVAIACRALAKSWAMAQEPLEFHWVIDARLQKLAQALLGEIAMRPDLKIHWHAIDASLLFQGNPIEKLREAMKLARIVFGISPSSLLLLHRDWRYRFLLRPVFVGRILAVTREKCHELDAYLNIFRALLSEPSKVDIDSFSAPGDFESRKKLEAPPRKTIGILIGGAQNQKILYLEKRWPHFQELISRLLGEGKFEEIVLFGGPDDKVAASGLFRALGEPSRVRNEVGQLRLEELPRVFAKLTSFISIDSGLAHIASSVMRKPHQRVLTLFGPTDPTVWAPCAAGDGRAVVLSSKKECSPCCSNDGVFKPCLFKGPEFQKCMTSLSVEHVLKALG